MHEHAERFTMTGLPVPYQWQRPNLLGFTVYQDTHMVDKGELAGELLRKLESEGWVQFGIADIGLAELLRTTDEVKREALLDAIAGKPIPAGTLVLDQSVLDFASLASEEDEQRLENLHAIIWDETHTLQGDLQKAVDTAAQKAQAGKSGDGNAGERVRDHARGHSRAVRRRCVRHPRSPHPCGSGAHSERLLLAARPVPTGGAAVARR